VPGRVFPDATGLGNMKFILARIALFGWKTCGGRLAENFEARFFDLGQELFHFVTAFALFFCDAQIIA